MAISTPATRAPDLVDVGSTCPDILHGSAVAGGPWRNASLIRPGTGTIRAQNLAYLDEHFQRYIESGRPAGTLTVVYHRGEVAYWSAQGLRDRERGTPITDDTIF